MSGNPWPFVTIDIANAADVSPTAINSAGEVVGQYDLEKGGNQHGFLYDAGTVTTFDVTGATETMAFGINAAGDIVGDFVTPSTGDG